MQKYQSFAGQLFTVDTTLKTMMFELRYPTSGSGKHFNWPKHLGQRGVGLNVEALKYAKLNSYQIHILWEGRDYETSPSEWISFAERTNSITTVKADVLLYMYPLVLFIAPPKRDGNQMLLF